MYGGICQYVPPFNCNLHHFHRKKKKKKGKGANSAHLFPFPLQREVTHCKTLPHGALLAAGERSDGARPLNGHCLHPQHPWAHQQPRISQPLAPHPAAPERGASAGTGRTLVTLQQAQRQLAPLSLSPP